MKINISKITTLVYLLVFFIIISLIEGYLLYCYRIEAYEQTLFKTFAREDYKNSIITHPYNICISNFDMDLTDVKLKYKTFEYKTIDLGNLPAIDLEANVDSETRNSHIILQHIEDMVSPIDFEVTGLRKDGTMFKGRVSGYDIYEDNETFKVHIDEGYDDLRYH